MKYPHHPILSPLLRTPLPSAKPQADPLWCSHLINNLVAFSFNRIHFISVLAFLLYKQPRVYIWFSGVCMCARSLQSCLTLCDTMDCNLPGSSVHGILQARTLEWVVMPSQPRGIFPTQGSNLRLLHCRWILYL